MGPISTDKLPPVNNPTMKKSSTNNLLNNSRTSQINATRVKESRLSNSNNNGNIGTNNSMIPSKVTYESTITHLKKIINKERKKVRELKNLYMR
jgi:hypothetical protein